MTTDVAENAAGPSCMINVGRTFTDENTRREIRQLTDFAEGASLGYFRMFRQLPGGRILAWASHPSGYMIAIDPASGDVEQLPHAFHVFKFRERDGRGWFLRAADPSKKRRNLYAGPGRQLWQIDLPHGQPEFVCDIPDALPGKVEDITIDGQHIIACEQEQDFKKYPIPTTKDVESLNRYFSRPRRGAIWVYGVQSGKIERILETTDFCPLHLDTSPVDPTLLRYCHDIPESLGQRIWTIRIDGSERRPIRPQAYGEMVTHEFWWADPAFIGYTYQDRRDDPTLKTHHWGEYSLGRTRLGIANLAGEEVYLSDPINSYHSHLYRSPDGRFISGEGTDGNSLVYAARFSWQTTRIEMQALATIHTKYIPFRGQGVDCNFSADGQWLIYADKREGEDKPHQLFEVKVDLQ